MLGPLQKHLEASGFETWARTYPSRKHSLAELTDWLTDAIRTDLGDRPVTAVTHSMGGILLRHLADRFDWRRAVLVAAPNQGSVAASVFSANRLFRAVYGRAAPELADSASWPAPPSPFAVIAGTRAVSVANPPSLVTRLLRVIPADQPSDGTVTVAETRLPDMADFATIDATHTWIMQHPQTLAMATHFLRTGRLT